MSPLLQLLSFWKFLFSTRFSYQHFLLYNNWPTFFRISYLPINSFLSVMTRWYLYVVCLSITTRDSAVYILPSCQLFLILCPTVLVRRMPLVLTRCSGQYSSQNLPAVPPVFSSLLPTRCCHSMCLNPYPLFPPVCPVTPAGWFRRNTCWVAPRTAQWWRRVWPVRLQAARKCLRCRPVASPPGKAHWPEWGSASCREPALSFPTSHCPLAGICKGCWLHNTNMNRKRPKLHAWHTQQKNNTHFMKRDTDVQTLLYRSRLQSLQTETKYCKMSRWQFYYKNFPV